MGAKMVLHIEKTAFDNPVFAGLFRFAWLLAYLLGVIDAESEEREVAFARIFGERLEQRVRERERVLRRARGERGFDVCFPEKSEPGRFRKDVRIERNEQVARVYPGPESEIDGGIRAHHPAQEQVNPFARGAFPLGDDSAFGERSGDEPCEPQTIVREFLCGIVCCVQSFKMRAEAPGTCDDCAELFEECAHIRVGIEPVEFFCGVREVLAETPRCDPFCGAVTAAVDAPEDEMQFFQNLIAPAERDHRSDERGDFRIARSGVAPQETTRIALREARDFVFAGECLQLRLNRGGDFDEWVHFFLVRLSWIAAALRASQ